MMGKGKRKRKGVRSGGRVGFRKICGFCGLKLQHVGIIQLDFNKKKTVEKEKREKDEEQKEER